MVDEVERWRWRWSRRFNRYGLLEERSFTYYRKFQCRLPKIWRFFFFPSKYPENQMFRMQKPPQRCLSEGEFAGNNECHAFDRPHHVTGGKGGERWRGGNEKQDSARVCGYS